MSEKLSEAIIDFANALEAACVQLKRYIGERHGVGLKESTFTSLLGWEKSQGERLGEFEYTSREANNNSDAFNHAYNILKANDATIKNHLSEKGWRYRYWLYPDRPDIIYRKLRKGKKPEPQTEKVAKADVEAVNSRLPEDLATLLTFEVEGNYVVMRPRQYLGSENFPKIASIVRDSGGEYNSAGKQSHFRVPLERLRG